MHHVGILCGNTKRIFAGFLLIWSEDSQKYRWAENLVGVRHPKFGDATYINIWNTFEMLHTVSGAFQLASPWGLSCRRLHKGTTISVQLNTSLTKESNTKENQRKRFSPWDMPTILPIKALSCPDRPNTKASKLATLPYNSHKSKFLGIRTCHPCHPCRPCRPCRPYHPCHRQVWVLVWWADRSQQHLWWGPCGWDNWSIFQMVTTSWLNMILDIMVGWTWFEHGFKHHYWLNMTGRFTFSNLE